MMADGNGLRLDDRAVLRIGGPEAAALLQGLVTCEIDALSPGAASHGALLTPQGKVLFDAIIQRPDMETFLFDTSAALAGDFLKRLMFYRLRAKVTLEVADDLAVVAWPDGGPADAPADPRLAALGKRTMVPIAEAAHAGEAGETWPAHRIALGIAELGADFASGEVFPHEANFDQLGGIDFAKGCYVGQEVVSRMQHRGTARKRFVPVRLAGAAPALGSDVTAGGRTIGTMGSSVGDAGLALIRLDRLESAVAAGAPVTAGETALHPRQPDWAGFAVPGANADAA